MAASERTPTAGISATQAPEYGIQAVLDLALERNPALAGAQGTLDQQKGQQLLAGAYPNPILGGQTGRGSLRDPSNGFSTTEYSVSIGQPLEWPGKRNARQKAATAGVAGADAGIAETRLNLIADVKTAFFDLLFAQQQLQLAQQNLGTVEDVRRIVGARVRLGEAPQFESVKAEVESLKAKQAVTRAENTVSATRVALDTLTAGALGRTYTVVGEFQSFPAALNADTLAARTLDQHPSLSRLAKQVEQADSTAEFHRQARTPDVTVQGSYWREVGREALTANLSVPIPLWYQRQGEIASALGARRKEEAELFRARNELLRAVNLHFQDAQATANLIDVFERGLLRQTDEALRIAQFSFRQGASSLLDVLDAQRVQRQVLLDYAQARYELAVSLTRLERAVGGPL
ncbi:MAG: TolC family protein [Nitrospiraceae bacterium]